MLLHNADIAARLDELADLLEIESANPFRIRAYRNAARTVRDLSSEITAMLAKGESLAEIPAVGKDLAAKIQEIAETGTTVMLEEHRKALPATITQFLTIPGLGPKRVKALHDTLDIKTLDELAGCRQTRPDSRTLWLRRGDGAAYPGGP